MTVIASVLLLHIYAMKLNALGGEGGGGHSMSILHCSVKIQRTLTNMHEVFIIPYNYSGELLIIQCISPLL